MFIVVKIKYVNSDNISDICDKLKFTTNYTPLQQLTHILSKHFQKVQFLTPSMGRSCCRTQVFPTLMVNRSCLLLTLAPTFYLKFFFDFSISIGKRRPSHPYPRQYPVEFQPIWGQGILISNVRISLNHFWILSFPFMSQMLIMSASFLMD